MTTDPTPTISKTESVAKHDRWDRRYRLAGDPGDALRALLAAISKKDS